MANDYQDAINKRKSQTASNTAADTSLTDWAKDGWDFIKRGVNIVSEKTGDVIEKVAPSDPEERIQREVVSKVNRDEMLAKAGHAGKALGNKINSVGGTAVSAGISFLKGALGAVSPEAKARIDAIDGNDTPSESVTPPSNTDNNNPVGQNGLYPPKAAGQAA